MNRLVERVQGAEHAWGSRPGWACVTRYGGIGDVIQATSLFPELREAGYKVAFNCDEAGYALTREDPHVDRFIVQKKGQIPPDDLPAYWERMGQGFDLHAQLSGRIEGELLRHPRDPRFFAESKAERHRACNVNYLEHIHDIAGMPHRFHARFYPTKAERRAAAGRKIKLTRGRSRAILLSLSGSSVHKVYPYWDEVVSALLRDPRNRIVTTGDAYCQILEWGWRGDRRVQRWSGRKGIRETLAFAEVADVVVGTETGVLNAVGLLEVPKVLVLSHSSVENLSKHWRRTASIAPPMTRCHPCHKMHFHSMTCDTVHDPRDPERRRRFPRCALAVAPDLVLGAIAGYLDEREAA